MNLDAFHVNEAVIDDGVLLARQAEGPQVQTIQQLPKLFGRVPGQVPGVRVHLDDEFARVLGLPREPR